MSTVERQSVVASAPNQNREHFDEHLERLIPYFAARALNNIVSLQRDAEPLHIDMWNSFGNYMDQAFKNQTQFDGADRKEYSTLLIDKKYKFLEEIGVDTSQNEVVRDDDINTINWIQDKLRALFEAGVIYEDVESVSVCVNCENVIAVATSNVSICGRCSSTDIRIQKHKTLFIDLPGDRLDYIKGKVELPKKYGFINGQFATLPGRVMIARKRDYGQPLGIPGYKDMVLDPKIGLSLMPEMVTERYNIDTITQIQGASTAKNTVPYTAVLSPNLIAKYIFTGNIPPNISKDRLDDLGTDFFIKYLPLYAIGHSSNIGQDQLQSLATEHSKVKRKFENAIGYLKSGIEADFVEKPKDISKITGAIGKIAAYDVRHGILDIRKFVYEDLGGQYIKDLQATGIRISHEDLESIEVTLREVF